jgi:hypothetical protein
LKNIKNPITSKLNFVKMVKDLTGYGLKESKDVCDDIHCASNQREIEVLDVENFIRIGWGDVYVLGDCICYSVRRVSAS